MEVMAYATRVQKVVFSSEELVGRRMFETMHSVLRRFLRPYYVHYLVNCAMMMTRTRRIQPWNAPSRL